MNRKRLTLLAVLAVVAGLLGLGGGQRATADDLSAGLVGYWKFDEDSGAIALDSANGNTGTIDGGASYTSTGLAPVAGNVSALTFDGVDDFVAVPHAAVLDVTTAYTLSVWLNMTNVPGYQPILFRGDSTADDIELYWYPGQALTVVHNRRPGGDYDGAIYFVDPPTGTLFHLAVVFDGNVVKAYYNGVPAAPSGRGCCGFDHPLPAPLATTTGWWIGLADNLGFRAAGGGSVPVVFNGLMDEVRIYNRALSESEVSALATPAASQCEADLAQCQSDLTTIGEELTLCTNTLTQATANLGQCNTNLTATQAALAAATADTDQDGVPNLYDHCPGTAPGAAVDVAGCSLAQFCAVIDATTPQGRRICKMSDWKNDQPLMPMPGDCTVAKGGPGTQNDRCVPQGQH